jgi:nitrite reductase (NADH) large subunit
MWKKRLAIIGNGMGTCRLLDELTARGAHVLYEITVYGEEPGGAYNRIMLGRVLGGERPDEIVTKTPAWYDRHAIRLLARTRVTRLDTLRKIVHTEDGLERRYDLAVFATGSEPVVPPLDGLLDDGGALRRGAFVYRTVADCLRIRQHARPGDSAVVVGGGLLGLEAAKVLSDRGLHVTVVHLSPTLMDAQLDRIGGEMLGRQIERAGIFVRAGRTVESAYGADRVDGVVLNDGTRLPADLVVLACGVRPRVDVARASGLPVRRGIEVNDTLATLVPSVYAFGECAEHQGRTYGIVAPVWEQAAVLADVLSATQPQARYRGSKIYTRLKVAGVDVASMGSLEPELESDHVVQIIEERRHAYRKVIVRDGRLLGAMLVGNTAAAAGLVQLYDRDDPVPADPLELLCQSTACAATPGDRVICNCHKVTEQTLRQAIAEGADSVQALGAATRAGTGCGSCRTELGQLLATARKTLVRLEAVS